jgi:hypothetical protein
VGITQIEGIQGAIAPADHHQDAIAKPHRSTVQLEDAIDRKHQGRDRPTGWHKSAIENWGDRSFG